LFWIELKWSMKMKAKNLSICIDLRNKDFSLIKFLTMQLMKK
jgi:hypothetical protein